jgi:hypothetical protein
MLGGLSDGGLSPSDARKNPANTGFVAENLDEVYRAGPP